MLPCERNACYHLPAMKGMIYYLFYVLDIYTCSLSITKLKFHFILNCRKMCSLEEG